MELENILLLLLPFSLLFLVLERSSPKSATEAFDHYRAKMVAFFSKTALYHNSVSKTVFDVFFKSNQFCCFLLLFPSLLFSLFLVRLWKIADELLQFYFIR